MSSKEQKTPEGQAPEEIITEQHDNVEAVEPEVSAEQVDPRDEKIANLEAQLAEAQKRKKTTCVVAPNRISRKRINLPWRSSSTNCCRLSIAWIARWKWLIKLTRIWRRWLKGSN